MPALSDADPAANNFRHAGANLLKVIDREVKAQYPADSEVSWFGGIGKGPELESNGAESRIAPLYGADAQGVVREADEDAQEGPGVLAEEQDQPDQLGSSAKKPKNVDTPNLRQWSLNTLAPRTAKTKILSPRVTEKFLLDFNQVREVPMDDSGGMRDEVTEAVAKDDSVQNKPNPPAHGPEGAKKDAKWKEIKQSLGEPRLLSTINIADVYTTLNHLVDISAKAKVKAQTMSEELKKKEEFQQTIDSCPGLW
ncbi:hypothetical protein V8F06_007422 [Rhypophila decipiens]